MMPPRSKVKQLPSAVKRWLDEQLVEGHFSGYEILSAELKARGYVISKTALHSYGQDFQDRLAAIKLSTEQARAVVASSPDEDGAVNDALMRLIQDRLFGVLVGSNSEEIDLPKMARAIAELGRASVTQKRHMAEVKARIKETAGQVETKCREAGMSADVIDKVRELYGLMP